VEDLVVEVEREKEKVRRMDEDKASLKRKLDRAAPMKGSSGGVNIAEEELRGLKVTGRKWERERREGEEEGGEGGGRRGGGRTGRGKREREKREERGREEKGRNLIIL
jgi:hypothetical protein